LWGPDDEEETWTWQSEPVRSLAAALPKGWYELHPIEVNPQFRAALLVEYTVARGPCFQPDEEDAHRHAGWLAALGGRG
jgi:hypothetical protein